MISLVLGVLATNTMVGRYHSEPNLGNEIDGETEHMDKEPWIIGIKHEIEVRKGGKEKKYASLPLEIR